MDYEVNLKVFFKARNLDEAKIVADNLAYFLEGCSIIDSTIGHEDPIAQKDEIEVKVGQIKKAKN